jgi:hypothetical protein
MCASILAAREAPELCKTMSLDHRGRRESRASDAPAASYAKVKSIRASHHRFTGSIRPSLRNGFNGFLRALSGDRAFLPPSSASVANLTPASGRRDHTTSPSALAPFVSKRQSVHRIPRPTFVTIAKRPSCGHGMSRILPVIWGRDQLRQIGTTGKSPVVPKKLSMANSLIPDVTRRATLLRERRDPSQRRRGLCEDDGLRISSAPRCHRSALRSVRGTSNDNPSLRGASGATGKCRTVASANPSG